MRVLIVEDERDIAHFIESNISREGYETLVTYDGQEGLAAALNAGCDIILLDMVLPKLDGWEFLSRLREKSDIPVICVTARDSLEETVRGLDAGANDYLVKPFRVEELLARMRVLLRGKEARHIAFADLELDEEKETILRAGKAIAFTSREYDLMAYFMHHPDVVLSRKRLLSDVWGYNFQGDSNVVDVYMRYVRVKLNEGHEKKHIETVRNRGYMLRSE